ncbi:hypothetical protein A33Q_1085 [Indibacter alkaliphilus LW1]|jgi:hypothetical protein|uniref:Uncharacterized protein n=1 Tax=Indibacter alkaliphilus (strain CCUG 57479 / KCTC 22604 / LW1) TaxID=1189612 RepID=S2E1T4_INDAL|nr:hypothetical protein [Indibacter alkaliphilus]EOZ98431.1 hypothetical protein A33Q_1085 [Indibacter alkaliphilus LW1]
MITSENLEFVLRKLDGEQIKPSQDSDKEYVLVIFNSCNAFFTITPQFTDDFEAFGDEKKEGDHFFRNICLLAINTSLICAESTSSKFCKIFQLVSKKH